MVDFFYHLDYLPFPEVEAITSPSDSETEIEFVHSGPSERMRRVPKKKVQVGVLDGESLATIAPEVPTPEPAPDSVAAPQPAEVGTINQGSNQGKVTPHPYNQGSLI